MQPVEGYKVLKEHLTIQDNIIRQKVLGLFIGNSVLLVAFFMSMSYNFHVFRHVLPGIALFLCGGLAVSLSLDIKAKSKSIKGLERIEEAHFAYLKGIQSRPITDIEHRARGRAKYRWLKIGDCFWPDWFWSVLSVLFMGIWALTFFA